MAILREGCCASSSRSVCRAESELLATCPCAAPSQDRESPARPPRARHLGRKPGIIANRAAGVDHGSKVYDRRLQIARLDPKLGVDPQQKQNPVNVFAKPKTHVDKDVHSPHLFQPLGPGALSVELTARVIRKGPRLGNHIFRRLENALELLDPGLAQAHLGRFALEIKRRVVVFDPGPSPRNLAGDFPHLVRRVLGIGNLLSPGQDIIQPPVWVEPVRLRSRRRVLEIGLRVLVVEHRQRERAQDDHQR